MATKEYQREYRKNNKEKFQKYWQTYKMKHREEIKMRKILPAERNEYTWHYLMRVRQFMQEHKK